VKDFVHCVLYARLSDLSVLRWKRRHVVSFSVSQSQAFRVRQTLLPHGL
jgi:hypothetical protein